jgi:PAS domain S-box-containing protein
MDKLEPKPAQIKTNKLEFHAFELEFMGLIQPNGILMEINQGALDFGGLTNQQVIGLPCWEASWWKISSENQGKVQAAIAQAVTEESIEFSADVLAADRRVAKCDFTIRPLKDQHGQTILLILKGQQVTEVQLSAKTSHLQDSNAPVDLSAAIVHNLPLGLNVWHLEDPQNINSLRLVATNDTVSYITGVSLSNDIGRYITDCYPHQLEQQTKHLELYAKVAHEQPQSPQQEIYECDRQISHHQISHSYFHVQAFSLPHRCVGIIYEDITQQKLTEQALQASESHYSALAKLSPVGIFRTDTSGNCLYVNERWCEITGISPTDAHQKGWRTTVHPDDLERIDGEVKRITTENLPLACEFRFLHPSGKSTWVFSNAVAQTADDGRVLGYIGTVVDISDLKQAEITLQQRAEELTHLNKMLAQTTTILQQRNQELDQFAYVASHDLKAPLRAISSLSQWLEEDLGEQLPPESQQQMRLLRGRVHRMEALINGLLEYSRVGRIHIEYSLVNVGLLLQEIIDSLQPPATFSIDIAPGMPTLKTKRLLLEQVFSNLISNAIQHHSQSQGQIKISVQDQGEWYEFAVTDDGPGIAPEYHQKVFEIFQTLEPCDRQTLRRLPNPLDRKSGECQENTGIGLAIVKKIVESQGGRITLASVLGTGSNFRFTWPKHSDGQIASSCW